MPTLGSRGSSAQCHYTRLFYTLFTVGFDEVNRVLPCGNNDDQNISYLT
jgi:hypothetical protein